MELTWKDAAATALTALAVIVFVAAYQDWNVWLAGDGNRWAAATILVIGMFTCGLGSPSRDRATPFLATLGVLALGLAIFTVVTGSTAGLALLTIDFVALWVGSLARHAAHHHHPPAAVSR